MRRFYLVMALAILLQACSGIPFLSPPANTSTPVNTSTPTVTLTPTITSTAAKTPTAIPTTTIVHIPTQDPNQPTATFIPILIFGDGNNTITPVPTSTMFKPGPGFESVLVSENKIFWGSCKHNKTTITAQVDNPEDVYSVVIFVRVKSLKKEDYTPWTTGDVMGGHKNGSYSYTLVGSNIEGHNHYKDSWVFFQLVATNDQGEEMGRSMIYTNAISLSPCK